MNSPYPDTVFHFTNSAGLKGILSEGFRLSHARELIATSSETKKFAVPIASFCDLRLSELPYHMKKYGEFGVGLTKSWAKTKGLNPVVYANQESEFARELFSGINAFHQHLQTIDDIIETKKAESAYMKILNALRYVKNYEGELFRRGKNMGKYRFADEREWRYVLPLDTKNNFAFHPWEILSKPEYKKMLNDQIAHHKLEFAASDVKYIIVPSGKNVPALKKNIVKLSARYSQAQREHLQAKIITAEQIKLDM
ncbi:abortive infection system antitoxin AbiGi family protein [Burkholderia gladioli]|uniref:abortive infection system antitoxin AbiGi family protein n=1 Tax=Burkholderia gladioli TaxID=28095 RepID=UPI003D23CF23